MIDQQFNLHAVASGPESSLSVVPVPSLISFDEPDIWTGPDNKRGDVWRLCATGLGVTEVAPCISAITTANGMTAREFIKDAEGRVNDILNGRMPPEALAHWYGWLQRLHKLLLDPSRRKRDIVVC